MAWIGLAALLAGFAAPLRAQDFVITEFMAANASGERDEDGDYSDWLEIHNPGRNPDSLGGWYLTNDPKQLRQWQFPEVTIPGQGFKVVFVSGKNRRDPKGNLHANFNLNREGGYLALVRPDGVAVASDFAPQYPRQLSDVSYGRSMIANTQWLVSSNAAGRLFLPADNPLGLAWTQPGFDDSNWTTVAMGIGYDRAADAGTQPPDPVSSLVDVTQPGDAIVATSSRSPENEGVANAIDNNPKTKYLNFDTLNAGLTVSPGTGWSVVTGLRLTSANDAPERDPTTFLLSGSDDGKSFTPIATGAIPDFPDRFYQVEVAFTNAVAHRHYRLLFPTVRNATAAVAVQIAEVEFLGRVGPAPVNFPELIQTPVESLMFGRQTSAYLRLPFTLTSLSPMDALALRVRYDDGFVAYLNGVEVARANAPLNLTESSAAVTNRARGAAVIEERYDLSAFTNLLYTGANVLALDVLNDRADSPEFLMQAQLENTRIAVGEPGYFESPTPGGLNAPLRLGIVPDVVFTQPHGFYEAPVDLALFCPDPAATIRYTLNGSVPSPTNGVLYTVPIGLTRTMTLRAAAFRDGWYPSRVGTRSYFFLDDVVTQSRESTLAAGFPSTWNGNAADYGLDPRVAGPNGQDKFNGKYTRTLKTDLASLPTLSLVMDIQDLFGPEGIYIHSDQRGQAWEKPVSVELIYPDQTEGFQIDAGVRMQGGAFRGFQLTQKKSFRLMFRKQYGQGSLRYPWFGPQAADHFDNITLRANSNDAWPYGGGKALYIRDAFAMETLRAMGRVASHTTFAHLYINGCYWGLYNPVERPDAAFSATYFGGDKNSWDAINQDSAPDGNYQAWNRMTALLNKGMSTTEAFQRIQGNNPDGSRNPGYERLLDMESLIDYMILNLYIGNADWPSRNWWVGRNRDTGEGFYFYPWDSETALGFSSVDTDSTGVAGAVAQPYAAMKSNAEFRLRFADHVYRHFFNGGALYVNTNQTKWDPAHPENNRPAARLMALADQISRAMVGESARWGDQMKTTSYTRDEHWQKERDNLLANYLPRRSAIVLSQFRRVGLYPKTDPPAMNQRGGEVAPGFQLVLTAPQGVIYYTTNGSDPRVLMTGSQSGVFKYTGPFPLYDLTTIKTRILNGQEWSALDEVTFVAGTPLLTVSELHYHPADPTAAEQAAGFNDADEFEFIELCNRGNASYDLSGARFVKGIEFAFTNATLAPRAPGHYILVVKNKAAFEKRYGAGLPVAGEYSGQLNNGGETLQLVDRNGTTILELTYGTRTPWPAAADGAGPSLELIDLNGDLNAPANWRASTAVGGSPGRANPLPSIELKMVLVDDSHLQLRFEGKAGRGYIVYVRDSMSVNTWQVYQRVEPADQDQPMVIEVDLHENPTTRFFYVLGL